MICDDVVTIKTFCDKCIRQNKPVLDIVLPRLHFNTRKLISTYTKTLDELTLLLSKETLLDIIYTSPLSILTVLDQANYTFALDYREILIHLLNKRSYNDANYYLSEAYSNDEKRPIAKQIVKTFLKLSLPGLEMTGIHEIKKPRPLLDKTFDLVYKIHKLFDLKT